MPPEAEPSDASADHAVLAEDQRVPLRLTATHGALGLELYETVALGPLTITGLSLTLPGLRFPLDLSGGVPKFRHRRGELERLTLDLDLELLEAWAAPRVLAVLDRLQRAPSVWPVPGGLGIGLLASGGRALAFDLLWCPQRGDAVWVVANARAVGFELPAVGLALRVLDTALGRVFTRSGRVLRLAEAARVLGKVLLPAVGARAPSADRVILGALEVGAERRLRVRFDASKERPELPMPTARAMALAGLVREADDELARGDAEAARAAYLVALESAPRHPEIVRLIAEIDARIAGRSEAALSLLLETLPATQAGLVGADLLAQTGDLSGARQAIEEAVRHEPFSGYAAAAWCKLAELETDAPLQAQALDRAVARAPGLPEPRWARLRARVRRGDVDGALSDAEHLEAAETGARARHEACRSAARVLLDAGFVREAGKLFERALRYLPDDATATAGLARSLLLVGRPRRALSLLERAVELGERAGHLEGDALIDLAKILADHAGDMPQAIARLRQVSASSPRMVEARFWEATYRARLGDRTGATLAFARMREAIELSNRSEPSFVTWLTQAADNAWLVERDAVAGERYLAVALRISPQDASLGQRYRELAAQAAEQSRLARGR